MIFTRMLRKFPSASRARKEAPQVILKPSNPLRTPLQQTNQKTDIRVY